MTMRFGKTNDELPNALKYIWDNHSDYKHVGDINRTKVLFKKDIYLLISDDNKPIAFFQVVKAGTVALLENMYVDKDYRKQGWMSMFLFFLKQNEGYSKIQFGNKQSNDTIEAVKRIYKRFDTYWVKGNDKQPYDPNTIDKYYSNTAPTGWNIVLENSGDFSAFPKFWNHDAIVPDLKIMYDVLLD